MSSIYLINVGLDVSAENQQAGRPRKWSASSAASILFSYGARILHETVVESDSEQTVVARVEATEQAIYNAAVYLMQDAIAVFDIEEQEGKLVGPRAAKWGEFDPHYFFCLDGSRLDTQLALEGEA